MTRINNDEEIAFTGYVQRHRSKGTYDRPNRKANEWGEWYYQTGHSSGTNPMIYTSPKRAMGSYMSKRRGLGVSTEPYGKEVTTHEYQVLSVSVVINTEDK